MLKRILFILFALSLLVICNCDEVAKGVQLDVPFHHQEEDTYCGLACIEMWSKYDWGSYTAFNDQYSIAEALGVGNQRVPVMTVLAGVSEYTNSMGHLVMIGMFADGALGDLVSSMIAGLDDGVPSIFPFEEAIHAAIVIGAEWKDQVIVVEDQRITRPLAINVTFHDPRSFGNLKYGALRFKSEIAISNLNYWTILGSEDYFDIGTSDHDTFVFRYGSYYGGPMLYDPKNLLPPDTEIF